MRLPTKATIDYLIACGVLAFTLASLWTVLAINERADRALYYIEGTLYYKIADYEGGNALGYDTINYESCKPFLRYELAQKALDEELEAFYQESGEGIEALRADLQIVEYR